MRFSGTGRTDVRIYSTFAIAQLGTSDVGISAISDVTRRDDFEFADVIFDVMYRRDISMNSHRAMVWSRCCSGVCDAAHGEGAML